MKKFLKLTTYIVGGFALLVLVASILVPMLVDPNDYKALVTTAVKDRTGRELKLSGDVRITVFPWLGAKIGAVELGNAPGFDEPVFARIDDVQVRVKLMPLLGGNVEMDVVTLHGLTLNLERDPQGVTNWADLAGAGAGTGTPAADPTPAPALALGGLDVRDATVRWRDATTGRAIEMSKITVETGPVALDRPIALSIGFDVAGLVPQTAGRVEASARVALDLPAQVYRLDALEVRSDLSGSGVPGGKATLSVDAEQASVDLANDTVSVTGLAVGASGLSVGGLDTEFSLSAALSGRLSAQTFDGTGVALKAVLGGSALAGGKVQIALATDLHVDLTRGVVETRGLELAAPVVDAHGVAGKLSVAGDVEVDIAANRISAGAVEMKGTLAGAGAGALKSEFRLRGALDAALAQSRYALEGLEVDGTLTGEPVPAGEQPFTLRASLLAELAEDRITIAGLVLDALGAKAGGDLVVTGLRTNPSAKGSVHVDGANPRALMKLVGLTPPVTSDPTALGTAAFRATVAGTPGNVKLDPLEISLDGARLTGSLALVDVARRAVTFDLGVDALNLDRYLPPARSMPDGPAPAPSGATAPALPALPLDALRALALEGRFRAGALQVSNVRLRDVRVALSAKDGLIVIEPFQAALYQGTTSARLELDARGPDASVNVDASLKGVRTDLLLADVGVPSELGPNVTTVALRASASGDPAASRFRISDLVLDGEVTGKQLPGGRVSIAAKTQLGLDLGAGTVALETLGLTFAKTHLTGTGSVSDLRTSPKFELEAAIESASARDLIIALGRAAPRTADPKVLGSASVRAKVAGTASSVEVSGLEARLDDTTLTGTASVNTAGGSSVRFDLAADSVDLDRYLPPAQTGSKPAKGAAASEAGAADRQGPLLPVDLLRALDLDGSARVGTLKISKLTLGEVAVSAKAKDGVLSIRPEVGRLYQGSYAGNLGVDARGAEPLLSLDDTLSNVDTGALLADLRGAALLTGLANLSAKVSASGNSVDAIRRSLGGKAAFSFTDGAFLGLDTARSLCQWFSASSATSFKTEDLIAGAVSLARSAAAKDSKKVRGQTEFAELSGTLDIADGIARNSDLKLSSPLLRVEGEGQIDLGAETLDYLARPALVASCEGQGGKAYADLVGVPVPVRLHGALGAPAYEVKLGSTLSALAGGKQGTTGDQATTAGQIGKAAAAGGAVAAGAAVLNKLLGKKDKKDPPASSEVPAAAATAPEAIAEQAAAAVPKAVDEAVPAAPAIPADTSVPPAPAVPAVPAVPAAAEAVPVAPPTATVPAAAAEAVPEAPPEATAPAAAAAETAPAAPAAPPKAAAPVAAAAEAVPAVPPKATAPAAAAAEAVPAAPPKATAPAAAAAEAVPAAPPKATAPAAAAAEAVPAAPPKATAPAAAAAEAVPAAPPKATAPAAAAAEAVPAAPPKATAPAAAAAEAVPAAPPKAAAPAAAAAEAVPAAPPKAAAPAAAAAEAVPAAPPKAAAPAAAAAEAVPAAPPKATAPAAAAAEVAPAALPKATAPAAAAEAVPAAPPQATAPAAEAAPASVPQAPAADAVLPVPAEAPAPAVPAPAPSPEPAAVAPKPEPAATEAAPSEAPTLPDAPPVDPKPDAGGQAPAGASG